MRLLMLLFLCFVVTPFVELALLLQIADRIGGWRTFALVIVTGFVGSLLARSQGFIVWRKIQDDLRNGRMPADSLADGAMVILAGALLITPGVLTDALGLALLIPPLRTLFRRFFGMFVKSNVNIQVSNNSFAAGFANREDVWGRGHGVETDSNVGGPSRDARGAGGEIVDSYAIDDEADGDDADATEP